MANQNAPFGFRPVRRKDGADWTQSLEWLPILNTDTTKIFRNDMVVLQSSGYLTRATASTKPYTGIFLGCEYYDTALKDKVFSNFWTGSSTALAGSVRAKFIRDPGVIFQAQAVGTLGILFSDVGSNIDAIDSATIGSTLSGLGNMGVDTSTIATTNTLQWQIFALAPTGQQGGDATLVNDIVEVCMLNVSDRTLTGV